MKVLSATVVLNVGADHVMIWTDLPSATPKVSKQNLMLSFQAEYDCGVDYVRNTFGIEPEIIQRNL